jgi:hypothetical protein
MPASCFWKGWLRVPSRLALMLGLGAAAVASARADAPADRQHTGAGDVSIRSAGGRIYLSEGGTETELRLGATPEHDRLLRLLQDYGPAGIKLDPDPRLIMSSGGGAGFYWGRTTKPATDKPVPAPQNSPRMTAPPGLPKGGATPREQYPVPDKKG